MHDDILKIHRHASTAEQPQHARLANLTPRQMLLETSNNGGEFKYLIPPPAEEVSRLVIASGQEAPVLVRTEGEDAEEIAILVVKGTRASRTGPPLPALRPGVPYAISHALVEHFPECSDLVRPEDQIRDVDGNVIGARELGWAGNKASAS